MSDELTIADYEAVLADHRRLVRRLDVALNGEDGAAPQASLCDIIGQIEGGYLWRPIESAPKDGAWIMAYWPTMPISTYPRVVFWDEGWICADRDMGEYYPTHWMPLPAAPIQPQQ